MRSTPLYSRRSVRTWTLVLMAVCAVGLCTGCTIKGAVVDGLTDGLTDSVSTAIGLALDQVVAGLLG